MYISFCSNFILTPHLGIKLDYSNLFKDIRCYIKDIKFQIIIFSNFFGISLNPGHFYNDEHSPQNEWRVSRSRVEDVTFFITLS